MKKVSLSVIYDVLTSGVGSHPTEEIDAAVADLEAELNKGAAQKAKKAEAYDALHDVIIGALSDAPVTCGELWEAIEGEVPEGVTKGKVQYALTHLWQDEIVKIEGKPNTYRKV